jgi:hypothetical protein
MSRIVSFLCFAALAVAAPVWAGGDSASKSSQKKAVTGPLKTAPGVVVRRAVPDNLEFTALGGVTPALADAGLTGRIGLSPLVPSGGVQRPQSYVSSFSFTPSGRVPDGRVFSVGMTSRIQGVADAGMTGGLNANTPANVKVGIALGYHGFAVEGGFNRVARATRPLAQGVDVGVSYRGADWKTSLKVSQEAIERDPYGFNAFLTPERRRAVELGGAYQVAKGVAVTGGLRYQLSYPDVLGFSALKSAQPDSAVGAVFFGTAVDF